MNLKKGPPRPKNQPKIQIELDFLLIMDLLIKVAES